MGRGRLLLADPASRGEDCARLPHISIPNLQIDKESLRIVLEDGSSPENASPSSADPLLRETGKRVKVASAALDRGAEPTGDPSSGAPGKNPSRRHICEGCGRSRSFWCGSCHRAVGSPEARARIPRLQLPFPFHIVRHPKEKASKSSAVPLAILAPDHVHIHMFPDLPASLFPVDSGATPSELGRVGQREPPARAARRLHVLLPDDDATPIDQVNWDDVEGCVLLDCTWFQVPGLRRHPGIAPLPKIALPSHSSIFWRQHKRNEACFLSTAECVYHVLVAFHEAVAGRKRPTATERRENGHDCEAALPGKEGATDSRAKEGGDREANSENGGAEAARETARLRAGPGEARENSAEKDGSAGLRSMSRVEGDSGTGSNRALSSAEGEPDTATARHRPSDGVLESDAEAARECRRTQAAAYDGRYDNILFYFVLCHGIILEDQKRRLEDRQKETRVTGMRG
ncbi:conserved hypothetical protein [Neospora caninum Liverpool]|uniref:tRNA-uridine aminocarboxypropyltransferase 1 n=1 Tax=Neospora caninum (strain Liverpool) TaxID=572307 RepID=F0VP77_NEOCL|nr:conserved hypothetical protein [Neospora caninum Liverpool]CBZ55523.1 conserved hypothetical protein [Neospora caninum Liverpool]CEL70261.1 TPA: DTW domain-containing protein [Neospora caninum Liverpool]|eukprot:XP_003885551.1 conserved hypothetical protein [Neospora caninum Liverpool]